MGSHQNGAKLNTSFARNDLLDKISVGWVDPLVLLPASGLLSVLTEISRELPDSDQHDHSLFAVDLAGHALGDAPVEGLDVSKAAETRDKKFRAAQRQLSFIKLSRVGVPGARGE